MRALLPFLSTFITGEVHERVNGLKRSVALYGVIGLFGLVTLIFLLVAANAWLSGLYGPIYAPLIIAGVALVVALIGFIATKIQAARARRRARERRRESASLYTTAGLALAPYILRSKALMAIGLPAAGLAAFLFLRRGGDGDDEA